MRLIDADELKKALTSETRNIYVFECLSRVLEKIDNAPTVDFTFEEIFQKTICENRLYCPARPTGEWISVPFDTGMGIVDGYKCSVCDVSRVFSSNYCPNCGAKMKGADNG